MKKLPMFLAIACVLGAGALWIFVAKAKNNHSTDTAKPSYSQTQKAPTRKTLTLPGSKSIALLPRNFSDAKHLWLIVSKDHPLEQKNYIPNDLVKPNVTTREDKSAAEQTLRAEPARQTEAMFKDAEANGHKLMMASGFRSYELQEYYFSSYVKSFGLEEANKFSARAGQSEHQTGLSMDISLQAKECYLEICFGETQAGKWLATNAYKYGFILRYPADKTDKTKYQYEPWHFRYIGLKLAGAIKDSGLTLDEAYPYLKSAYEK